jgi:ribosome-binding protein aMBF1 (putative translation factor)
MSTTSRDLYSRILALLTRARAAQGVSSADLATKHGISEEFVADFEAGRTRLDPAEFVTIARAVGVDPYELLAQAEQEVG